MGGLYMSHETHMVNRAHVFTGIKHRGGCVGMRVLIVRRGGGERETMRCT